MDTKEVLDRASGRTIIVGEHHIAHVSRDAILALIQNASRCGYRKLGVEINYRGTVSRGLTTIKVPGFIKEMVFLCQNREKELSERFSLTSLGPGKWPRWNRHWYMQLAINLNWQITPIDLRWKSSVEHTHEGYFEKREISMARSILKQGKMVFPVGSAHLKGLHDLLGDKAFFVNSECVPEAHIQLVRSGSHPSWLDVAKYESYIRFAMEVPLLTLS